MRFFDYIRTAFKNLYRQKLRTTLTITAVVIGTLAVVTLISLVNGAKSVFLSQLEAIGAFTEITVMQETDLEIDPFGGGGDTEAKEGAKLITDETVTEIEKIDNVEAISPVISVHPLQSMSLVGDDKKFNSWGVRGVAANAAGEVQLAAGEMFKTSDKNKIIIGPSYANKLGFEDKYEELIGKKVVFSSYEGFYGGGVEPPLPCMSENCDDNAMWEKVQEFEAKIVGIGLPGPDEQSIYMPLDWARDFMIQKRYEPDPNSNNDFGPSKMILISENDLDKNGYSNLIVKVDDPDTTDRVAEDIGKLGYTTITAKQFLDSFMQVFNIIGYILGIIGGISLFVASIGIVNTMIMSIYERTKEIGVMRATGATKGTIRILFTFEAAMIGFLGGITGVIIGFILGKVGNVFINNMLSDQGMAASDIIQMPIWMVGSVVGFTSTIGLLAGLYPASRAARMDPVEALRYE